MLKIKKEIKILSMSENDKRNFAVSIIEDMARAYHIALAKEPLGDFVIYCSRSLWEFIFEYASDKCSYSECRQIGGVEVVLTELRFDAWHLASLGERDHAEMLLIYSPDKEGRYENEEK